MKVAGFFAGVFCFLFMNSTSILAANAGALAASAEASPFTDVSFAASPSVKVQVEGEEFYLLDINGKARAQIIQQCEASYAADCQCAFAERFTEVMAKIGSPVAETVSLRLYRLASHEVITKANQPVNSANLDELKSNRELRNELCYP